MAAKSGPLLLLAGAAALFLLGRKKKAGDPAVDDAIEEEKKEEEKEQKKEDKKAEEEGRPPRPRPPKPYNVSGDSAGYNTEWFPNAVAVRTRFVAEGYPVEHMGPKMNDPLIKNAAVKQFQRDYNLVSEKLSQLGLRSYDHAISGKRVVISGKVNVDGTAGKNTLNALELAHKVSIYNNSSWKNVVNKARQA